MTAAVPVLFEACVESLAEAMAAVNAGAGRLEVCGAMSEAGITPSIGLIESVIERVPVPVFVMARPRGGDFAYGDDEIGVLLRDIAAARSAGAHGIVSGALTPAGLVDRDTTRRLVEAASPLDFTFHRAIDLTPNLEQALDALISIGVRRVLTSGGASTALVGAGVISRLVRRAGTAATIVGGGNVRSGNVAELLLRTSVTEVHARPVRSRQMSPTLPPGVKFGALLPASQRDELDAAEVRAIVEAIATCRRLGSPSSS